MGVRKEEGKEDETDLVWRWGCICAMWEGVSPGGSGEVACEARSGTEVWVVGGCLLRCNVRHTQHNAHSVMGSQWFSECQNETWFDEYKR